MKKDPDARVRKTAVRVAKRRAPSPALETALTALALNDDNAATRQGAVELLGRWLPERPGLRSTLEQVAVADARSQIRAVARAALDKS
jgi:HEAT repeat protein